MRHTVGTRLFCFYSLRRSRYVQEKSARHETLFDHLVQALVSLIGTAMTPFVLLIWAYKRTGDATTLALLGFFAFIFYIVGSPLAGVYVDRWDKLRVLLASDTGAGLVTIMLLALYSMGDLHIWHLYAAGLRSLAFYGSKVLAPMIAGVLLVIIDLRGVMLIDVATFLVALITLALVAIPRPLPSSEEQRVDGSL